MAAFFDDIMTGFVAAEESAPAFFANTVEDQVTFLYLPYLGTTGVSSASLAPALTLPRNTLVKSFDVVVGATRATSTPAQAAGQVRAYNNAGSFTVIVDFGVPRTVSSVSVRFGASVGILNVSAWIGAKFDAPFFGSPTGPWVPTSEARFSSEVRTERLLIAIDSAAIDATIGADLLLELPDQPTDLALSINGGAPVWTHPGPAQPNNSETLGYDAFNKNGERLVALADALNALLADPLNSDPLALDIVLSAKVPGVLSVAERTRDLQLIRRMSFNGDSATTLAFAAEGAQPLALQLPAPATGLVQTIRKVQFTALATPVPERVLPPVGPPAALMADGQVLAELVLDPDHAAIVRLPPEPLLAELTGLRLPLAAGGDGAEARVVLWSNLHAGAGADEPGAALPAGASEPVTLPGGGGEAWVSFKFSKPVPLDAANPPWAAVLVARGQLGWALARRDDAPGCDLRRGAPNGPWRPLPAPFAGPLLDACGRVRRIGHPPKAQPLPPWQVSLSGETAAAVAVAATPKGAAVTLTPATGATAELALLAYAAGSLTLRDIDVVWAERPPLVA